MNSKITRFALLLAPWLLAASLPASALVKWDNATGTCASATGPDGSIVSCSPTTPIGGTSLVQTAVSDTGTGGAIAAAYLGTYSGGLGVTSNAGPDAAGYSTGSGDCASTASGTKEPTCSPEHAMDNNGNYEYMLLSFGASVSLGKVQVGWYSGDSDITVLAYTGCAAGQTCNPNPVGDTYNSLVGNTTGTGWTLVGHYSNPGATTFNINAYTGDNAGATSLSSSYWLIGAYNNAFSNSLRSDTVNAISTTSSSYIAAGNDYVKLLAVYGETPTKPGVPEPSTLLLGALAFLGLTELRRRARA